MDRRDLLKNGAAAIVGGTTSLLSARSVEAGQAPAVVRSGSAGRPFRAWVRSGTQIRLENLRTLPLGPRSVLIRTEATQCCYSMVGEVLAPTQQDPPKIVGHGGVGVVEDVGVQVKRVRVGDRVIVANTPQCGQCANCLQGRSDMCDVKMMALVPVAERPDGTQVVGHNNYGGFGELMIAFEEYLIPTVTRVPPVELAVLSCVGAAGLAAAVTFVPVQAGTNVAVMGCGPIGLSAVQGARICGAKQIIAVEPIAYRRELAARFGATTVLDPNVEGDRLVERVTDLCRGEITSLFGGGRNFSEGGAAGGFGVSRTRPYGPDFVIEAVGRNRLPPKAGAGPDPTGLTALRQAYLMTAGTGHLTTLGVYEGDLTLPAGTFSISGRTHHSGQLGGGANSFRDMPRFVRLIEKGLFDAKSMATSIFPLEQVKEAFQAAADRTTVTAIVTMA
ncbi:MAG: alcohol dehydrogenase catalytic domain-containing protein [Acidobacteria bacterium]|nr:alcohol dehydrogenase catalytic domain-containing protein [Acidobacteriota bacterium]